MNSRGIPPSEDKLYRRRIILLSSTAITVFMILVLVFWLRDTQRAINGEQNEYFQAVEQEIVAEEAEEKRASAYAALRDYMDKNLQEPGITAVFCRESRHKDYGSYIDFRGDIDLKHTHGTMIRKSYHARVRGSIEDGWRVSLINIEEKADFR